MQLYLSGVIENISSCTPSKNIGNYIKMEELHILQTFFSVSKKDHEYWSRAKSFLMDSGAFSMMAGKRKNNFDILDYTKRYGEYVKEHNVDQFIELDIDHVFGIQTYKDCLHCLQDITGREPIRVFHLHRGWGYYKDLVKKFDRICIGGIAVKDIKSDMFWIFEELLKEAHKNNCKVHGLGIGSARVIREFDFDSVDTAGWIAAMKFGSLYRFDGHSVVKYDGSSRCEEGRKISRVFAGTTALDEWTKYSQYVDTF